MGLPNDDNVSPCIKHIYGFIGVRVATVQP